MASGDPHVNQAGESQLKIVNATTTVVKSYHCQCELKSPTGMEARCQQAGWVSAPNQI